MLAHEGRATRRYAPLGMWTGERAAARQVFRAGSPLTAEAGRTNVEAEAEARPDVGTPGRGERGAQPGEDMFEPFTFIIALVLGIPIAKAVATRISRGGQGVPTDQVLALRKEVEATEARAVDAEKRVTELEDRVDFLEKLLQAPKQPPLVPPGGPPMNV